MNTLYITKDKRTGVLIYASYDLDFVRRKTQIYFDKIEEKREFVIDIVVYIEPAKNEII